MRTRSFNFLAFAAVGASAVQTVSQREKIELFIPENGFISLNAPLTPRRTGTLSTRTTHPHFIDSIQDIFDQIGIPCKIVNPYQFKTKGQMAAECQNRQLLAKIADNTVSCSHWKRKKMQCGICVPCIIRRAALHAGRINDNSSYCCDPITGVLNQPNRRDDLQALRIAVTQKTTREIGSWVANSGPLPADKFKEFQKVFLDGLNEVESFLKTEGIL